MNTYLELLIVEFSGCNTEEHVCSATDVRFHEERIVKRLAIIFLTMLLSQPALSVPLIKVMTYNIRFDGGNRSASDIETPWIGSQGRNRRDMVLDIIETTAPDILGLQEALYHQFQSVGDRLKGHDYYTVGRLDGKRAGEHCSIFFRKDRFALLDKGTFWLCETPDRPGAKHPDAACERIASWVRLRDQTIEGSSVLVLNTHWDHRGQLAREYAAKSIADHLAKVKEESELIVMGDLNATTSNEAIESWMRDDRLELVDCYRSVHPQKVEKEATFNAFRGYYLGERIDHVFSSPGLEATSAEIVRTSFDGYYPSDHFPVVVELSYK